MSLPPPDPPRPVDSAGSRLWLAADCLALLALGVVLGVVGAFHVRSTPHLFGVPVPVGPVIAVVGNFGAAVLGTAGTGTRVGGLMAGLGWLPVVVALGNFRPEGDLVVPGDGRGLSFVLLGVLATTAGIGLGLGVHRPGRAGPRR